MDLNEAIYKIRSKEKMIRADFEVGTGDSQEYLTDLIAQASTTTKKELNKQVREGYFTSKEAQDIHKALSTMPMLECLESGEAVATYPEFKANELHIHSVAIKLAKK